MPQCRKRKTSKKALLGAIIQIRSVNQQEVNIAQPFRDLRVAAMTGGNVKLASCTFGFERQLNLFHYPVCFDQDFDDALIVANIVKTKRAALAVF